jgi:S-adenosylmethionine-diacylglycerol 3-amino-3-carboxypropyl transferase
MHQKKRQQNPLKKAIYSQRSGGLPQLQFFSKAFQGILYNQIWEDPEVDRQALQLDKNSKVIAISSGGCNALNYLIDAPQKISMVDIQYNHLQIAKMRFYALKYLPTYEDLLQFFGIGKGKENIQRFYDHIFPNLTKEEKDYWESPLKQLWKKFPKRISIFQDGFYSSSKASLAGRMIFPILGIKKSRIETFLHLNNTDAQKNLFDSQILPTIQKRWRHLFFKIPSLCAFLGVHPNQIEILQKETNLSLKELFIQRVRQSLTDTPCETNYFAWQVFLSRYNLENQNALPLYLQKTNYNLLKSLANHNVCDYTYSSILTKLAEAKPGDYNRFVLLDAQEWMNQQDITQLWSHIIRVGGPGARIIFRTGTVNSYLFDQIPSSLSQHLTYHEDLSKKLFQKDRLKVYGGFHCYEIKA